MKFQDAARAACDTSMDHLAETTRQDLTVLLREHGRVGITFSDVEIGLITADSIREWAKENSEVKPGTIDKYLYAMSFVYQWAIEQGKVDDNPVAHYRRTFRKRYSKAIREASDPSRNIRPLRVEAQKALLNAVDAECTDPVMSLILLQLDAGLRVGEALAIRWEHIEESSLLVCENLPRYVKTPEAPKSGHIRRVDMSSRLRDWLIPMRGIDLERVVNPFHYGTFRANGWKRILKRANLVGVRMKDLRDTYACTLANCGVPITYIADQLGHSDITVTARHYAQWSHKGWKPPVQLLEGQVPADLLAISCE